MYIALLRMNLGVISMLESDMKTAEILLSAALRILQKNNHPECCICMENLAELNLKNSEIFKKDIQKSKQYKMKMRSYLRQALKASKSLYPKNSPRITRIQLKLTTTL